MIVILDWELVYYNNCSRTPVIQTLKGNETLFELIYEGQSKPNCPTKTTNRSLFSTQLTQIMAMLLCAHIIVNLRILGLI